MPTMTKLSNIRREISKWRGQLNNASQMPANTRMRADNALKHWETELDIRSNILNRRKKS